LLEKTINSVADMVRDSFVPTPAVVASMRALASDDRGLAPGSQQTGADGETAANGGGGAAQLGFNYNGVWQPLCFVTVQGTAKSLLLELVDKHDAPQLLDGYCVSLGHAILVDTMYAVHRIVTDEGTAAGDDMLQHNTSRLLFSSTHNGVHAGLALLLEASTDEHVSERLLHCIAMLTSCACRLDATSVRDACVLTLCAVALPHNYLRERLLDGNVSTHSQPVVVGDGAHGVIDPSNMSQVVATSTSCPQPNLPAHLNASQVFVSVYG
jgi:hypothetical protein